MHLRLHNMYVGLHVPLAAKTTRMRSFLLSAWSHWYGSQVKTYRAMEAEFQFSEFTTSLANRMPDTNTMELVACLTISEVHSSYYKAMKAGKTVRQSSIRQFRSTWKTYFSNQR